MTRGQELVQVEPAAAMVRDLPSQLKAWWAKAPAGDQKWAKGSGIALVASLLAWLVYAIVMHAPINPRFRGRRAAILSIFGFLLVFGTLVAVQFMPTGGNG